MQAEDRIELAQQFVTQRQQLLVGGKWHMFQCTPGLIQVWVARAAWNRDEKRATLYRYISTVKTLCFSD